MSKRLCPICNRETELVWADHFVVLHLWTGLNEARYHCPCGFHCYSHYSMSQHLGNNLDAAIAHIMFGVPIHEP